MQQHTLINSPWFYCDSPCYLYVSYAPVVITPSVFNALCDTLLFCLVDLLLSSIIVVLDPLILLSLLNKTVIRHCNLLLLFMVVSFRLISVWRYLPRYVCLYAWLLSRDLIVVGYHDGSHDWSSFDWLILLWLSGPPSTGPVLLWLVWWWSECIIVNCMMMLWVYYCVWGWRVSVLYYLVLDWASLLISTPRTETRLLFWSGNCARLPLSWSCM
jgi:hypothetical protein